MKKYIQDDLIRFEHNGETFYCRITDNDKPIRMVHGIEKMSRYANFFDTNMSPITSGWAIYGTVDEMTNITPIMVEKWYCDYLNKKIKGIEYNL